jgi:hypothetical protein
VAHPLFILEDVPGVDGAVAVAVALDTDQFSLVVKLGFFEAAISVGVDFQTDRTTFLIDVGDLVYFSVSIGVSFNALGLLVR